MTHKQINGPVNVVRLEGNINGIKKILYLFMDIHNSKEQQTKCENINATEINDYFYDSFLELNNSEKMYDFFVEFQPRKYMESNISQYDKKYFHENQDMYINKIYKLFKQHFQYENNKIKISNLFNHVRFHYIDIRDWVHYYIIFFVNILYDWMIKVEQNIPDALHSTINFLAVFSPQLKFIREYLKNPKSIDKKIF